MHKLQNGQVSTLGFAVRTEIWTSWWPRHWTPTQGTSCALSLQQNYRLSSLGLICTTGAVTGHCFWHKAHCHSCHSWPRLITAPSPNYPLSKLGDSSQQHPRTQRKQSMSHTSINHFCSYSVKRLLGGGGRDEWWQGCGLWVRDQQEGRLGEPELKLLKEGAGMAAPHESIPPPLHSSGVLTKWM